MIDATLAEKRGGDRLLVTADGHRIQVHVGMKGPLYCGRWAELIKNGGKLGWRHAATEPIPRVVENGPADLGGGRLSGDKKTT